MRVLVDLTLGRFAAEVKVDLGAWRHRVHVDVVGTDDIVRGLLDESVASPE